MLDQLSNECVVRRDDNILKATEDGRYLSIIVDGWEGVDRQHLLGVIMKAGSKMLLMGAIPEGSVHHACATAKEWEECLLLDKSTNGGRHLKYFLTDNAGNCAKARRILALRFPHIVFTHCWAHQVNQF